MLFTFAAAIFHCQMPMRVIALLAFRCRCLRYCYMRYTAPCRVFFAAAITPLLLMSHAAADAFDIAADAAARQLMPRIFFFFFFYAAFSCR